MNTILHPRDEADLAALVADARAAVRPLAACGGGTKQALASPGSGTPVGLAALSGIPLYEPSEMVIRAGAGTPLATLTGTLAASNQMLAFEPPDWHTALGGQGEPTVGGMIATNLSGPRRVTAGACRDSLIGMRFVNGAGEAIRTGGRVMKNVTGYDLGRLLSGSWGTLGIITEVTFKVLPRPETETSLVLEGLDIATAIDAMAHALTSPFEVSGASWLPPAGGAPSRTVLRLENFATSIAYRSGRLTDRLKRFGAATVLDATNSAALWTGIRNLAPLAAEDGCLWRIVIAPSRAAALVAMLEAAGAGIALLDWGGAQIFASIPAPAAASAIRQAQAAGGQALPLRAPDEIRATVPWFNPPAGPARLLQDRIRSGFDPAGIMNPGRTGA